MDNNLYYQLFPNSWVQTFDDSGLKRPGLIYIGALKDTTGTEMRKLNERGAGIFIQPNPSTGRKKADVTSIDWLYVDMDEGTKAEMMAVISKSPISPDIIVESKRSYHLYWKCKTTDEQFHNIIEGLVTFFGGDPAISSIDEVLRAPGFYHCKNPDDRFMTVLHHIDIQPHTPQDFMRVFPTTSQKMVKKFGNENPDDVIRVIKNIDITEILKHCGVDVRSGSIWENGKETSGKVWKEKNIVMRFSGKEGGGSTIDIVMHHLGKTVGEAIAYLKEYAGIADETTVEKISRMTKIEQQEDIFAYRKPYTYGTPMLDKVMSPVERHHYNLFVGETGSGKTQFCYSMAKKNAELGHKVLFLSLEMDTATIIRRQARQFAGITQEQWREPHTIPQWQQKLFYQEKERIEKLPNITLMGIPPQIKQNCETIKNIITDEKSKFDLVFIDNFDMIEFEGKKFDGEEMITTFFLKLSKEKKIPIFMIHHFKKGNDSKTARGTDSVKGNAKVTHGASNLFIGSRDMEPGCLNPTEFTITQRKNREFGGTALAVVHIKKGDFQDDGPIGF